MLNHASWRLFRAKLKLRFLSRRTQLNRTELGSPPPWAPLRHCHCHSAQLSSNEMKWMATNSARKWHAFISGHETRPSPIRFAQESLVSGEISLPNVWGPGTFMFYFIVLMRIFARDQRKYLLSTILKYERFLAEALASPQVRLRKCQNIHLYTGASKNSPMVLESDRLKPVNKSVALGLNNCINLLKRFL